MNNEHVYRIALSIVDGIGPVTSKALLLYYGNATNIFEASKHIDHTLPKDVQKALKLVSNFNKTGFKRVEDEYAFIDKEGISLLYPGLAAYPTYLTSCADAPALLYFKGNGDLNRRRKIGIVGTRKSTDNGRHFTEKLIEELAAYDCIIISGLAYGIDITAHKAALKYNLPTFAVMGTGLDKTYPSSHSKTALQMMENGGLVTEYMTGTEPNPENFPMRNRIVAGLCDCIVVIESAVKGGSMLTAEIASTYNRDVFALPGRASDEQSSGCNYLIKHNKAALIENARDIATQMGWDTSNHPRVPSAIQAQLFTDLPIEEKAVFDLLKTREQFQVEELIVTLHQFTPGSLAGHLLSLELKGVIRSLPGKVYKIN